MVQKFEQNICAVISLDDDGELLLWALRAVALGRLGLVLQRCPPQNSQNTITSMVFSGWKQRSQRCSHQEDEQDGEDDKLGPNSEAATGKPA